MRFAPPFLHALCRRVKAPVFQLTCNSLGAVWWSLYTGTELCTTLQVSKVQSSIWDVTWENPESLRWGVEMLWQLPRWSVWGSWPTSTPCALSSFTGQGKPSTGVFSRPICSQAPMLRLSLQTGQSVLYKQQQELLLCVTSSALV